jgi:leader peptidase (prepilin peptidase)/N-methyltransferase
MSSAWILFALAGLVAGGVINILADDLPAKRRPRRPTCSRCQVALAPEHWLAVLQVPQGARCPNCGLPTRHRALAVEIGCALLFGLVPLFIAAWTDRLIGAFYIAVLILVIVTDLEHRLVLHVVTFPVTAAALVASIPLSFNSLGLAAAGALVAFVFFYLAYRVGRRLFGPGALGFGDVTLAMMLGAMLGLHQIVFALVFGILLAGIWSLVMLTTRRMTRSSYFAYGPFLAVAGIAMVLWGQRIVDWYANLGQ